MTKPFDWACLVLVCGAFACSSDDADSSASGAGGDQALEGTGGGSGAGALPGSGGAVTPGPGGSSGEGGTVPVAGAGGAPITGGMPPIGGMTGMNGSAGMGAAAGMGGEGTAGMGGGSGGGTCCSDGDCLCHGPDPTGLTSSNGPFNTDSYDLPGAGCVYYPTDAEPPFAAVAISDGFLGTGGCGLSQTNGWGPLYASHGIVAMIINTGSGDQPQTRGSKLSAAIEAFKSENQSSSSPLSGKLAGRYGTSGFSMGGGGTTYSAAADPSLRTSVAIMPWGPTRSSVTVPSLVICGASDGIASCTSHGTPFYSGLADSVPKMRVVVSGGHNGQPTAGGGESGEWGLAFQKVFLEGDERWRPFLVGGGAEATNIQ